MVFFQVAIGEIQSRLALVRDKSRSNLIGRGWSLAFLSRLHIDLGGPVVATKISLSLTKASFIISER